MHQTNLAQPLQIKVKGEVKIHDEVTDSAHKDLVYKMIKKQFSKGSKKCQCGRTISMTKASCLECSKTIQQIDGTAQIIGEENA